MSSFLLRTSCLLGCVLSLQVVVACGGRSESGSSTPGTGGDGSGGSSSGGGNTGGGNTGGTAPAELEPEICPDLEPCGGDVSGTWNLVDLCSSEPEVPFEVPACATERATVVSTTGTGTQTFANGTIVTEGSVEIVERFDLPLDCVGKSCDQIEEDLGASLAEPGALDGGTFESFSCGLSGEVCVCALTMSVEVDEEVAYVADGTTLTTTTVSGERVSSYCVDGDRLTVVDERGVTVLQRP